MGSVEEISARLSSIVNSVSVPAVS
jgi:hypothetical protein